ncbi:hypothetical protein A9K55_009188 [Cordyceps militaris]|uniref:Uncharacterized protein n=1 Tax=Cordyceps militaris TaxID=73501 RepID=A0A2H4SID5_CORMI|nr:hypothetical protein A9K55_009188 [Cordyceps militaris]
MFSILEAMTTAVGIASLHKPVRGSQIALFAVNRQRCWDTVRFWMPSADCHRNEQAIWNCSHVTSKGARSRANTTYTASSASTLVQAGSGHSGKHKLEVLCGFTSLGELRQRVVRWRSEARIVRTGSDVLV